MKDYVSVAIYKGSVNCLKRHSRIPIAHRYLSDSRLVNIRLESRIYSYVSKQKA